MALPTDSAATFFSGAGAAASEQTLARIRKSLASTLAADILPAVATGTPDWLLKLHEWYSTKYEALAQARPAGVKAATDEMKRLTEDFRTVAKNIHNHFVSPTSLPLSQQALESSWNALIATSTSDRSRMSRNFGVAFFREGAQKQFDVFKASLIEDVKIAEMDVHRQTLNAAVESGANRPGLRAVKTGIQDCCTRDFAEAFKEMKPQELATLSRTRLTEMVEAHYRRLALMPELQSHPSFSKGKDIVLDGLRSGIYPDEARIVQIIEGTGLVLPVEKAEELVKKKITRGGGKRQKTPIVPEAPLEPEVPPAPEAHLPTLPDTPPPAERPVPVDTPLPIERKRIPLDVLPPDPVELPKPVPTEPIPAEPFVETGRRSRTSVELVAAKSEAQEGKLLQSVEQSAANLLEHGNSTMLEKGGIAAAALVGLAGMNYLLGEMSKPRSRNAPKTEIANANVGVGAISDPSRRDKGSWQAQASRESDTKLER